MYRYKWCHELQYDRWQPLLKTQFSMVASVQQSRRFYELNRFYFWRVTCEQNTCDLSHTHTQKEKQNRPHHKNTNTHVYSRPIENKSLANCNRSIICSAFYFRCQSVLQLAKKSKPSWFRLNHHNFYLWSGIVVIICSASLVVFVYCCCCFS